MDHGFPIQDGENIPEWLAKVVYAGYCKSYGTEQSYERLRERGGFGMLEVIWCLHQITTFEDALKEIK